MIVCFILCCNSPCHRGDDVLKLIFAQVGSLAIALLIFYLTRMKEWAIISKNKRDRLSGEIFALCELIIRTSIHASSRALAARYHYAHHKKKPDDDFDKTRYINYIDTVESLIQNLVEYHSDLSAKISQIEDGWFEDKAVEKIKRDLYTVPIYLNHFDGVFMEKLIPEQIDKVYERRRTKIEHESEESPYFKMLRRIEQLVLPKGVKPPRSNQPPSSEGKDKPESLLD